MQLKKNAIESEAKLTENRDKQATITLEQKLREQRANLDKDYLFKTYSGIVKNISDALGDGIERISKSFFEDGKLDWAEGAREWAKLFFDNIRKTVTENLITKPLQEFVTDSLGKLGLSIFGIGKRGESPLSPIYTFETNPAVGGTNGALGAVSSGLGGISDWLFGSSATGRIGSNGLPMYGGLESLADSQGALSSAWDWLSNLFASGGSVKGFANGGSVKGFASGGIRDRIPSMLEPGEFVVRKAMVNQIGRNNLQQLNATGKMNTPNIQINVTNEGSAKQYEQGTPRFDGENWVIDLISRDIENNGILRKQIRGLR